MLLLHFHTQLVFGLKSRCRLSLLSETHFILRRPECNISLNLWCLIASKYSTASWYLYDYIIMAHSYELYYSSKDRAVDGCRSLTNRKVDIVVLYKVHSGCAVYLSRLKDLTPRYYDP